MKFLKKNRFGDHSDFYIYNKKKNRSSTIIEWNVNLVCILYFYDEKWNALEKD